MSPFTSSRPWQLVITSMHQAVVVTIITLTWFFTPLTFDVIVVIALIPLIHGHSSFVTIYRVHRDVIDIVNYYYHLFLIFRKTVGFIILLDVVENIPSFIVNHFVMQLLPCFTIEI